MGARGVDERPVQTSRIRKSVGSERTLKEDITDIDQISHVIEALTDKITEVLQARKIRCRTVTLKIRYHDFVTITRSVSCREAIGNKKEIISYIPALLEKTEAGSRPVRLLGVSASNLVHQTEKGPRQLLLPFRL